MQGGWGVPPVRHPPCIVMALQQSLMVNLVFTISL
jgi:hypothetical protein